MYNVIISKKVEKMLDKISNDYYQLIIEHLLDLEQNPRPFGSIKLADSKNTYRIRVDVCHVIYTIQDDVLMVEVVKIDHRGSVYK
ncbi:MAG: type II toxin-antitoxin system RelE/ParE family toxin [Tannerellaceae bacterium]|jgi:mRNA interferase RelE/StbE|nr:type II toxin-antitoxin system RelE/ParE family toxin [Tannerellaceae bacterium]